jgi:hypothetical protein
MAHKNSQLIYRRKFVIKIFQTQNKDYFSQKLECYKKIISH